MSAPDVALISPFPTLAGAPRRLDRRRFLQREPRGCARRRGRARDRPRLARGRPARRRERGRPRGPARCGTAAPRRCPPRPPPPSPPAPRSCTCSTSCSCTAGRPRCRACSPRSPRCAAADAVVTMHHVVDPRAIDAAFTATHRVSAPAPLARVGVAAVQRTIAALADTVVVHEPSFTSVVRGAAVVPHGIETPGTTDDRAVARAALGVKPGRLCVLCFGFLAPYKGLEAALERRAPGRRRHRARDRRRRAPAHGRVRRRAARLRPGRNARFIGYVADEDVARWFAAADVALLPYPQPFASSGPLALALAHGTPCCCRTRSRAPSAPPRSCP